MPFDWNEFLTLAERLSTVADNASKRTAISRAYYFVFNVAFARAQVTTGQRPSGETYHKWCWDRYRNSPDPLCMKIGLAGERMSRRRVRADYESADLDRLDDQVRLMLDEARKFRTDIAALNPRYPLP